MESSKEIAQYREHEFVYLKAGAFYKCSICGLIVDFFNCFGSLKKCCKRRKKCV